MMKFKLSWRIWLLIIVLALCLLAIKPSFKEGVLIKSVEQNSTAFQQGLRQGQIIKQVDNIQVNNAQEYSIIMQNKFQTQEFEKTIITTEENEFILFTDNALEITVSEIPSTNIKTGLDLQGGARALIKAQDKELTQKEIKDLIAITNERLNVYGISDVKLRAVSDLLGNNYMLVEVAGATPDDLKELISKQGKFEAKIGNETVFVGGEKDITSVCRDDAQCARIESCQKLQEGGTVCRFAFQVYLSESAAQRHADITSDLEVNQSMQGNYLSKKLDLYLDDNLVDSLLISENLKGRVTTQIQIQGSGTGTTREDAVNDALDSMNTLQTVLITGSLPYKLEIIKLDTVSPLLGQQFTNTIIIAGFSAIFAVALIVFVRYKKIKSSLALLLTSFSELIIILGIASIIKWNLDLPSIAGILATIGTGVDQQIVILDESRTKEQLSVKQKLKRALFIVMSAYFTTLFSLIPLYWAGGGLLKGFAVTTIIGITSAILITRPAFADIIKKIEE